MATATAKAVLDTVEDTLDEIEDQLDILEAGAQVVKSTKLLVGTFVVSAFCAGAALTYFIAKKKLSAKYDAITQDEIEKARNFYAARYKADDFASPTQLAEKYLKDEPNVAEQVRELTQSYRSDDISVAHEKIGEVTAMRVTETGIEVDATLSEDIINVFREAENLGDFDYEEELKNRTEEAPYIITYDEWRANESDYEQGTLTYFAGDDTLADSESGIISDTDDVVGDDNLLKFGYGSRDNNVVYIRNDRLELEWEVICSKGKFAKEVLGFDDEEDKLQHSYRDRRPRRFRSSDE